MPDSAEAAPTFFSLAAAVSFFAADAAAVSAWSFCASESWRDAAAVLACAALSRSAGGDLAVWRPRRPRSLTRRLSPARREARAPRRPAPALRRPHGPVPRRRGRPPRPARRRPKRFSAGTGRSSPRPPGRISGCLRGPAELVERLVNLGEDLAARSRASRIARTVKLSAPTTPSCHVLRAAARTAQDASPRERRTRSAPLAPTR